MHNISRRKLAREFVLDPACTASLVEQSLVDVFNLWTCVERDTREG